MKNRQYLAIDLKSFYASVECVERGFNPMTTHLVVADASRTEKTICLAVSPSLKSFGIPGRARLFQVLEKLKEINHQRQEKAPGRRLTGTSIDSTELSDNPSLGADIFIAPPQMAHYMEWSTRIYQVYLKYIAPEDIHVYSIDEVFMDVTSYLNTYRMSARELAKTIIQDVLASTGITATAGIGTNLFLCKAALDIGAKHVPPDADGVRIAQLDEQTYRQTLWSHRPLTDFWRVGRGYADKLARYGIFTMGDIARCSLGAPGDYYNEELLYRLFGVNAELLIDHAWGWEPCTIADIKAYRPKSTSLGSGQVLPCPYSSEKSRLVVRKWRICWLWTWWKKDWLPARWFSPSVMTSKILPIRSFAGNTRTLLPPTDTGGPFPGTPTARRISPPDFLLRGDCKGHAAAVRLHHRRGSLDPANQSHGHPPDGGIRAEKPGAYLRTAGSVYRLPGASEKEQKEQELQKRNGSSRRPCWKSKRNSAKMPS